MDGIGVPMSPDDIVYDIKSVGGYGISVYTDKREFPTVKIYTALMSLTIILAAVGIIMDPMLESQPWATIGYIGVVSSLCLGFLGFMYWMEEEVKWTPNRKTESVGWAYTDLRPAIDDQHLWHYGYRKAVSDLYREAKSVRGTNTDIHPQWQKIFQDMNVAMRELTEARNASKAPVPTFEAYVKPIEIEKEFIIPTGKYSLAEMVHDFDD